MVNESKFQIIFYQFKHLYTIWYSFVSLIEFIDMNGFNYKFTFKYLVK